MQFDNFAFWGLFLLFAGIVLLVREIFSIDFPVLKIVAGLFFILLGIKIMFGNFAFWPIKGGEHEILFSTSKIAGGELLPGYKVVFSQATFDMDNLELDHKNKKLTIDCVFSGSTIYLPPDVPVRINVDAIFASVKMPGRVSPVFGKGNYTSENFDDGIPYLDIKVNIVFGSVVLTRRN